MIPAEFDYSAPTSLDEALALLGRQEDAKLLAGGHSLLPALKLRLASTPHLIDLGRVPGLTEIREDGGVIAIGAMATHHSIETSELLSRRCPLLTQCAAWIGDLQVRNRGTIGGSLAHADPGADYPAAVLALEGEIVARSATGTRTIAAEAFFVDMLTTTLEPGEILTEVRVQPFPAKTGSSYRKEPQPASGFAIVGVAVAVTLDGGRCSKVRIGVTGAASKAWRAKAAEEVLQGNAPEDAAIAAAAQQTTEGIEMNGDIFASAEYRAHLVRVYARRALREAADRARSA
ncbi:MAG: aerobic carbon-monoxide dehydrogenase medium subunit [Candidatus Binatota bacterium]|jgi:carbon-monoxide dehydrogenase medium subunit|nr:aerobic carbon-monoxide dehydrogenase medium subunit [Candidatus Binatota bacterium]